MPLIGNLYSKGYTMYLTTFFQGQSVRDKENATEVLTPIAIQLLFDGVNVHLSKVTGGTQFDGSATAGRFYKLSAKATFDNCGVAEIAGFLKNIGKGKRIIDATTPGMAKRGDVKTVSLEDGVLILNYASSERPNTNSKWKCNVADIIEAIGKGLKQLETMEQLASATFPYIGKAAKSSAVSSLGDIVRKLSVSK